MSAKARRYILVPLLLMVFMAFGSLITGRTPDLALLLFVLIVSWATSFFRNRDPVDVDAPPTRKELGWAIASVPVGLVGLGFAIYQLVTGIDRGMIEISSTRNWTVSWADHPFGFAFTLFMQAIVAVVMIALLYYCWFTIREGIDERRARAERP